MRSHASAWGRGQPHYRPHKPGLTQSDMGRHFARTDAETLTGQYNALSKLTSDADYLSPAPRPAADDAARRMRPPHPQSAFSRLRVDELLRPLVRDAEGRADVTQGQTLVGELPSRRPCFFRRLLADVEFLFAQFGGPCQVFTHRFG